MNNIVIIPSLEPNENIIKLIEELKNLNFANIIIVNDGSNRHYDHIFDKLKSLGCIIITHKKNIGKGESLKDGIKYASKYFDKKGYITADGDYQHLPTDILKVASELENNQNKILLGVRNFKNKNVPLKSRFGNKFSSIFFKLQTGIALEDTQTGLRGIPKEYTKLALEAEGKRYDYEMNFLRKVALNKIELKEVEIETIYNDQNKGSHFKTVSDAILIYKELIHCIINSLLSATLDIALFAILVNTFLGATALYIAIANITARLLSGVFNFFVNSKIAFKSKEKMYKQIYRYITLFIAQLIVSSLLIAILSTIPINIVIIKIFIDITIFVVNYFIEKRFIFK